MTYAIYEANMGTLGKSKIGAPDFDSLDAAYSFAMEKFAKVMAFIEKDEENEAYDFMTTTGTIYAIEAVK